VTGDGRLLHGRADVTGKYLSATVDKAQVSRVHPTIPTSKDVDEAQQHKFVVWLQCLLPTGRRSSSDTVDTYVADSSC